MSKLNEIFSEEENIRLDNEYVLSEEEEKYLTEEKRLEEAEQRDRAIDLEELARDNYYER